VCWLLGPHDTLPCVLMMMELTGEGRACTLVGPKMVYLTEQCKYKKEEKIFDWTWAVLNLQPSNLSLMDIIVPYLVMDIRFLLGFQGFNAPEFSKHCKCSTGKMSAEKNYASLCFWNSRLKQSHENYSFIWYSRIGYFVFRVSWKCLQLKISVNSSQRQVLTPCILLIDWKLYMVKKIKAGLSISALLLIYTLVIAVVMRWHIPDNCLNQALKNSQMVVDEAKKVNSSRSHKEEFIQKFGQVTCAVMPAILRYFL